MSDRDADKYVCAECDWKGIAPLLLRAANPFNADDMLIGCPSCKSVNTLSVACDEDGCWDYVTCGTPTADGYRRVCGLHFRRITQSDANSRTQKP